VTTPADAKRLEDQHRNRPGVRHTAEDRLAEFERRLSDLEQEVGRLRQAATRSVAPSSRGRSRR
jgi:hypothetical protein